MVEITKGFQCFFVRPPFKLYFRLRPATKSIKTASGAPRPKSAPRTIIFHRNFITYRTKLKLDKEVGGGDLSNCVPSHT